MITSIGAYVANNFLAAGYRVELLLAATLRLHHAIRRRRLCAC